MQDLQQQEQRATGWIVLTAFWLLTVTSVGFIALAGYFLVATLAYQPGPGEDTSLAGLGVILAIAALVPGLVLAGLSLAVGTAAGFWTGRAALRVVLVPAVVIAIAIPVISLIQVLN